MMKRYTPKELKELSEQIANKYKITYEQAARIVANFSAVGKWEEVARIKSGDEKTIRAGAESCGVKLPKSGANGPEPIKANQYKTQRDIVKPSRENTTPEQIEIIEKYKELEYIRGELPAGLAEDIKQFLKLWAEDNNIESLDKCSSLQWRAACIYCGWWIKEKGVLFDREAMARSVGGSRVYDGQKVAALLDIFQALSAIYKHIPLHTDFISFSGISREWFFDYNGAGLTSSNIQIIKKAMEIENAAISAGVTDSRENPTGRIFYAKARLGWRENDTIQQIDDKNSGNNNALPVFDLPKLQ